MIWVAPGNEMWITLYSLEYEVRSGKLWKIDSFGTSNNLRYLLFVCGSFEK